MWRVILGTVVALMALGTICWAAYWFGHAVGDAAAARKAGMVRNGADLLEDAEYVMHQLVVPKDLDDPSYLTSIDRQAINTWRSDYARAKDKT